MPPTLPFDQEVLQRSQQPRRTDRDFFVPRSERILESNVDYRMSQPEEPEYQPIKEDGVAQPVSLLLHFFYDERAIYFIICVITLVTSPEFLCYETEKKFFIKDFISRGKVR